MRKKIILIFIIVILILINNKIESIQKRILNVNSNDINSYIIKTSDKYDVEEESINFVYKFLQNPQSNLTKDFLDNDLYNIYNSKEKIKIEEYIKKFEVNDKNKNEQLLVKVGKSIDVLTNITYVRLDLYITEKSNNYTSKYGSVISGNSLDSNKKFTFVVSSDRPYNFKLKFFPEDISVIEDIH
jgi:hypothetical protein